MSEIDNTSCEFTREVLNAAHEARQKASADWSSPLAAAYAEVARLLTRILHRHLAKCPICQEEEAQRNDAASIAGPGPLTSTTLGRQTLPPQGDAGFGLSIGVAR